MGKSDEVFAKVAVRLTKVDPSKQKLFNTFKFTITDDGGSVLKTWFLDLKALKLTEGTGAAECTLTVTDQVMFDIGAGTIQIKDAIVQGKVKVDGSVELAELLQPFVSSI
jgi:putative sterol carrier protein